MEQDSANHALGRVSQLIKDGYTPWDAMRAYVSEQPVSGPKSLINLTSEGIPGLKGDRLFPLEKLGVPKLTREQVLDTVKGA
jgi:hypothetical protein